MRVSADNDINIGHGFCELLVFRLFNIRIGAAVGQADNDIRVLCFQAVHTVPGGFGSIGKAQRGVIDRVILGDLAEHAKDPDFQAAALDDFCGAAAIGIKGVLDLL